MQFRRNAHDICSACSDRPRRYLPRLLAGRRGVDEVLYNDNGLRMKVKMQPWNSTTVRVHLRQFFTPTRVFKIMKLYMHHWRALHSPNRFVTTIQVK